ncbi:MAG: CoA ester lyase [Rhizobiales bacterium]|nr:CoA ester lyase [Hyphomicrobiales bacterium]
MTGSIRPRRSVLYMPGINQRALEKAKSLAADCLILDLEDSVAPDAKETARDLVCAAVKNGGYGDREVIIRVNGLDSDWGQEDLKAAAVSGADGILIPKVGSAATLNAVADAMRAAKAPENTQIWAMLETPHGILNAEEISALSADPNTNLTCLIMGTNDLLKETRTLFVPNRYPVLTWLSMAVLAARAYGLDIIDGVYNNFSDEEGLQKECNQGRALGFDGKTLIHPGQLALCNEIFTPSDDEIEWSRKILAAFLEPQNAGKGVITVEGQMVELLHAKIAERTVAIAQAIENRQQAAA